MGMTFENCRLEEDSGRGVSAKPPEPGLEPISLAQLAEIIRAGQKWAEAKNLPAQKERGDSET